jgi:hypothetical protein
MKDAPDVRQADVEHEQSDVNIRAIFGFAAALLIAAIVIHGLVWLLFVYFSDRAEGGTRQYPLAQSQDSRLPPEPRLQVNPREDLQEMRAVEDELLNGYRWVDKNTGIIRIPINDAMRLTLERGLPTRPEVK